LNIAGRRKIQCNITQNSNTQVPDIPNDTKHKKERARKKRYSNIGSQQEGEITIVTNHNPNSTKLIFPTLLFSTPPSFSYL
jgi:hypothetical protein